MHRLPTPRRLLARMAAAAILALAAGAASAAEMSFYAKNHHPFPVAVELFGRDRVWPGDDQVYLLDGKERKSVPISAQAGRRSATAPGFPARPARPGALVRTTTATAPNAAASAPTAAAWRSSWGRDGRRCRRQEIFTLQSLFVYPRIRFG